MTNPNHRSLGRLPRWLAWPSLGPRWEAGGIGFAFTCALVNVALYHLPLYSFAISDLDGRTFNGLLTLATLFVAVFVVTALMLLALLLLSERAVKPVCMVIAVANAVALYFLATYQAVLDKSMMGNVANTDFAEAAGFLHPKLILYVCVFGLLPCWVLSRIRIRRAGRLRVALTGVGAVLFGLGWVYLSSSTWLWIDSNAKRLGGMVLPWSYVVNMARYQSTELRRSRDEILLPAATFASDQKTVVVLVIGETARAQNFSLYGYGRLTNPLLAEAGAVALKNSLACSTYTTASLRCILASNDASSEFAARLEPLPSYLHRFGADVIWRTNNWGEPPVKVQTYQRARDLRPDCVEPGCDYDEVLLTGLVERIRASRQPKVLVVLHQRGSHGPSYHSEYPAAFEVFTPVCTSVELSECSDEELRNAYDNTILYTDYFLSRTIALLEQLAPVPTLLMYVSDHGESLGEYGLYLHGTPFTIAPEVQKAVPFIVWMSDEFMATKGISPADIDRGTRHSQGNVFHSIMGAFDMHSPAYDAGLDIFNAS